MRSYVYDKNKLPQLFAGIVNRLGGGGAPSEVIEGLLKDVCEHFHFGCGLIYETDHTDTLHLKEAFSAYKGRHPIPVKLNLEDHLLESDSGKLRTEGLFQLRPILNNCDDPADLSRLFQAGSLLLTPVLLDGDSLVGLVVMLDRRHNILIDSGSVEAAQTVLRLLSNHVMTRVSQRRLSLARQSLSAILDNLGVDVFVCDLHTQEMLFANKSLTSARGGWEKIRGRKCWDVVYGLEEGPCENCPRDKLLDSRGRPSEVHRWDYQRPFDGAWFRICNTAFQWMDGRPAHVVCSLDITENKRNEEIINRLAYYDDLTGLPNRRKFVLDSEESFARLALVQGRAWLLFFDLDNFKAVNDRLGHQAGDELLTKLGLSMEADPETRQRCYRMGGDEFVLFYERVSPEFIDKMVGRLLEMFDQPWDLAAGRPVCRTSIGVARYPDDGQDSETLLLKADLAMYQAKEAGKGQAFFTDGRRMASPASQRLTAAGQRSDGRSEPGE